MKRFHAYLLMLLMVSAMVLTGCGSKTQTTSATDSDVTDSTAAETTEEVEYLTGTYKAQIIMKDYGTIVFEMDADQAPITVTNFVALAKRGFYDGLTFHRIINGFMMQGGDPLGNGTGGTSQTIKGEFSANGVENSQSHTRGAVSMARSQSMDSASCQFFIVHQDSDFLDGNYACFGYVTEGMDVVDAICENTPVVDGNGTVNRDDQPIIESITILGEE